jgi:hypothetical protein
MHLPASRPTSSERALLRTYTSSCSPLYGMCADFNCQCFWRVHRNTLLEAPGPVPCAAQQGTTFVIEDLFYNIDQRRKVGTSCQPQALSAQHCMSRSAKEICPAQALGSASEEYGRILDLLGRYAIARPDVAFSCKKQASAACTSLTVVLRPLHWPRIVLDSCCPHWGCRERGGPTCTPWQAARSQRTSGLERCHPVFVSHCTRALPPKMPSHGSLAYGACRAVHGASVAQSLLPISASAGAADAAAASAAMAAEQGPCFTAQARPLLTAAGHSARNTSILLLASVS